MLGVVTIVELLFWNGCPSHPAALADLRAALAEVGRPEVAVRVTEIESEDDALERSCVGGTDILAPGPGEPAGLTCRVYRRRDGRPSPTPDPLDLRDALRRLLTPPAEEE
jgi:hypothetical protein